MRCRGSGMQQLCRHALLFFRLCGCVRRGRHDAPSRRAEDSEKAQATTTATRDRADEPSADSPRGCARCAWLGGAVRNRAVAMHTIVPTRSVQTRCACGWLFFCAEATWDAAATKMSDTLPVAVWGRRHAELRWHDAAGEIPKRGTRWVSFLRASADVRAESALWQGDEVLWHTSARRARTTWPGPTHPKPAAGCAYEPSVFK